MKLVILFTALAMQSGSAPTSVQPEAPEEHRPSMTLPSPPGAGVQSNMPNVASQPPGCRSIRQQIQDQARRHRDTEYRTLDREPPAHLQFAVDRHVGGCREVTFLRRNVAPGTAPAVPTR